jgi:hypothetical protein
MTRLFIIWAQRSNGVWGIRNRIPTHDFKNEAKARENAIKTMTDWGIAEPTSRFELTEHEGVYDNVWAKCPDHPLRKGNSQAQKA